VSDAYRLKGTLKILVSDNVHKSKGTKFVWFLNNSIICNTHPITTAVSVMTPPSESSIFERGELSKDMLGIK